MSLDFPNRRIRIGERINSPQILFYWANFRVFGFLTVMIHLDWCSLYQPEKNLFIVEIVVRANNLFHSGWIVICWFMKRPTFEDDRIADAKSKRHSTISEGIQIGLEMRAKHTILTHLSQRYPRTPSIDHSNVTIAHDFFQVLVL